MNRAVWVDEGHALHAERLRAHGITAPYFSHRRDQAGVTKDTLQAAADAGFRPGIYSAWNWYTLDGPAYARLLDRELRRIGWPGNAPLCVDIETHDVEGYVLPFFREWRRLRPSRPTHFTFEGWQGGLYSPANVLELVGYGLRFVPQLYRGDMAPVGHSPLIDLLIAGFPGERLDGFYDAAALPYRWRGFAFTQARLP